jgi:hypothetical protein
VNIRLREGGGFVRVIGLAQESHVSAVEIWGARRAEDCNGTADAERFALAEYDRERKVTPRVAFVVVHGYSDGGEYAARVYGDAVTVLAWAASGAPLGEVES